MLFRSASALPAVLSGKDDAEVLATAVLTAAVLVAGGVEPVESVEEVEVNDSVLLGLTAGVASAVMVGCGVVVTVLVCTTAVFVLPTTTLLIAG